MQKIIISNFGPVKSADIDIKQFLILIGEQASGKSTTARLIYFFKKIPYDLIQHVLEIKNEISKDYKDLNTTLHSIIQKKFLNYFGAVWDVPDFNIKYYYDFKSDKSITISHTLSQRITIIISPSLLKDKTEELDKTIKELLTLDIFTDIPGPSKVRFDSLYTNFVLLLKEKFGYHHDNYLYIVEGRNATVSYSSIFENYLFADLQNRRNSPGVQSNSYHNFDYKSINEILMLEFIRRIYKIKEFFKKYENFERALVLLSDNDTKLPVLRKLIESIEKIIKGKFTSDNAGEKINFGDNNEQFVYLSDASSGQKESIRILQDLFFTVLTNESFHRIIEEPEAHLFPLAQKQTIELFAQALNTNKNNNLILTTHSPYILTSVNNLLLASKIKQKFPSSSEMVDQIIPSEFHFSSENTGVYALGYSKEQFCKPILDVKTGMIEQNYLDAVSDSLAGEFDRLYTLYVKLLRTNDVK